MTTKDVVFIWDDAIPTYTYCPNACHPMKPLRLELLYNLLEKLGILPYLRVMKPPPIDKAQMEAYHASEYLQFLKNESTQLHGQTQKAGDEEERTPNSPEKSDLYQLKVLNALQNVTIDQNEGPTSVNVQSEVANAMGALREAILGVREESFLDQNESEQPTEVNQPSVDASSKRVKVPKKASKENGSSKARIEGASEAEALPEQGASDQTQDVNAFFQLSSDCPAFDGVYDYSAHVAAGSVAGAVLLNAGAATTVIHWAGGLHHAHRFEAAGFCYVNDIVLSIIELLKVNDRVLYIDIDVHHGDGVEEAFITSDRVLTVSFHRHGRDGFFPGTGDREDIGIGKGEGYALNVPLYDGVSDEQFYWLLYKPIIQKALQQFQPNAIVMQCGADSIAGDRIGRFNLSSAGHARCVALVQQSNIPALFLGGGGYTMANVARTWALETAMLCKAQNVHELSIIPPNAFDVYYSSVPRERVLGVQADVTMPNENSPSYIDQIRLLAIEQMQDIGMKDVEHSAGDVDRKNVS